MNMVAPSSLFDDQLANLRHACTRCENFEYDATVVRTAELRALLSAYEQAEKELQTAREEIISLVHLKNGRWEDREYLRAQLAALTASKEPQK